MKGSEKKGLICIPSGNHDMERIAWRLDEEDLKVAFAFLLSMPEHRLSITATRSASRYTGRSDFRGGRFQPDDAGRPCSGMTA